MSGSWSITVASCPPLQSSYTSLVARSCLFCGSRRNLTKEHVYPAWLHRALGIGGPIALMYGSETVRVTRRLDTTLREVCAVCNNGWLHDLERSFGSLMLNALQGMPGSQRFWTRRSNRLWRHGPSRPGCC